MQALTYATRCSLYSISIQNSTSLLSPIPQSSAGDDVVFCSSESVGCSISDMTIIESHEHFTVFTLHARVHVALSRHCPPHELVYAAFIAYTTAASGMLSSSPHPPPCSTLCQPLPPLLSPPVPFTMTLQDFRAQMAAAGWSLTTHQLRLGDHRLQDPPSHHKSS